MASNSRFDLNQPTLSTEIQRLLRAVGDKHVRRILLWPLVFNGDGFEKEQNRFRGIAWKLRAEDGNKLHINGVQSNF